MFRMIYTLWKPLCTKKERMGHNDQEDVLGDAKFFQGCKDYMNTLWLMESDSYEL